MCVRRLAYPMGVGGWRLRPSVARGRRSTAAAGYPAVTGAVVPGASTEWRTWPALNRVATWRCELDLRPPVLERTFDSGWVRNLLRHDVKHTIEPELTYR